MVIPVTFFVVTAVFFMLRLIPGDPVDMILGENASVQMREQLVQAFHFNDPISLQYKNYIKDISQGHFGKSYFNSKDIDKLVRERFLSTLHLALLSIVLALSIALPLGIASAIWSKRTFDHVTLIASLAGVSIPSFYLGPLLVLLFSIKLDWFPAQGNELPGASLLPAVTLALAMSASLVRLTRASMLDVLEKEYVRTARAKGLRRRYVIIKHALRTGIIPVVSVLGLQFGTLLAGTVVTEKVFAWPGIGSLMIESIAKRDYALVQSCVLLIAMCYVVVNLATDLLCAWLDPRIRQTLKEEAT